MTAKAEHIIVMAMGTNVNQEANVERAKSLLLANFKSVSFSEQLWTMPIGLEGSDKFLNLVAVARTSRTQSQVEAALKYLENKCGRKRGSCNHGVVAMDLDLLRYDDEICHPDDWERDYIKKLVREMGV